MTWLDRTTQETTVIRVVDIDKFDRLDSLMTVEIAVKKTTRHSWWTGGGWGSTTSTFEEQFLRIGEPLYEEAFLIGAPYRESGGKWYSLEKKKCYSGSLPVQCGGTIWTSRLEELWMHEYAERMMMQRELIEE